MDRVAEDRKHIITTLALALALACAPGALRAADPAGNPPGPSLTTLFADLARPDNPEWARVESDILRLWSQSGSAAMDLLLQRGEEALALGDTAAAIDHFTAATDHAPDFPEAWNGLATAYYQAGRLGEAVAAIRRTLLLEPRHFGALSGLATILEETGRPEAALAVLRQVQATHPHLEGVADAITRLDTQLQGKSL